MAKLTTPTRLKLAYAGLAAIDSWLSGIPGRRAHLARFVTKPLLMPTLAASLVTITAGRGLAAADDHACRPGRRVGWRRRAARRGDGAVPRRGPGHSPPATLAYLGGFVRQRSKSPVTTDPAARTVAAAWALTAPAMALMARRTEPGLGRPVLGYTTMLATMVVAATHLDPTLSPASRRLTAAGAGMFMLSDTLLGLRQVHARRPSARPRSRR